MRNPDNLPLSKLDIQNGTWRIKLEGTERLIFHSLTLICATGLLWQIILKF